MYFPPEAVNIVGVTLEVNAIPQTKQVHRRACIKHPSKGDYGAAALHLKALGTQQLLLTHPAAFGRAGAKSSPPDEFLK